MEKIKVTYQAGEGRYHSGSVDWMMAKVEQDGEVIELYAEMVNESWDGISGDETATYDALKAEIIAQAQEHGIDVNRLEFFYDNE